MIKKLKALIIDGFLYIIGGSILIKLMGFISNIFVVRIISKSEYGLLSYADNIYSYVSIIAGLGMSTAIIVKCNRRQQDILNNSYFSFALTRGIIIQFIATCGVVLYFYISSTGFDAAQKYVWLLFLYPIATYIMQCVTNYVRAYQYNKLYSKAAVTQSFALAVFSIFLAFCLSAKGVIIARYVAIFALILVTIPFLKDKLNQGYVALNKIRKKNYYILSITMLFGSIFSELMYSNEMMLVNRIIKDEIVTANYKVAVLLPMQLFFVTQSLLVYFIPKFVELQNDRNRLLSYACKVGLFNFLIIFIIVIIAMLITPKLIVFMYGEKYLDCISLSIKFWIAYGINAAIRIIPINVLATTGNAKANAYFAIIGCIIHFVIARTILIESGIEALPIAISVVYIVIGVAAWGYLFLTSKKDIKNDEPVKKSL